MIWTAQAPFGTIWRSTSRGGTLIVRNMICDCRRRTFALPLAAIALPILTIVTGCSAEALREDRFNDPAWTQNLRPADPVKSDPWGLSSRARQIESNMGVR